VRLIAAPSHNLCYNNKILKNYIPTYKQNIPTENNSKSKKSNDYLINTTLMEYMNPYTDTETDTENNILRSLERAETLPTLRGDMPSIIFRSRNFENNTWDVLKKEPSLANHNDIIQPIGQEHYMFLASLGIQLKNKTIMGPKPH
jgi:hypothetical protein